MLSVLAVVLVHKPTARTFYLANSCSFTHLVAHALHLGAIEVSLRLRAAPRSGTALRLRLRDGARSLDASLGSARGGAVVRRLDIPARGATSTAFTGGGAAARGRGSSAAGAGDAT